MAEYRVIYTSMECHRESSEASWDDEIYLVTASMNWRPGLTNIPRVLVQTSKTYTNVDAGETKGANNASDNLVLWGGGSDGYSQMEIASQLILAQAFEADPNSNTAPIDAALEIALKERLVSYMNWGSSRSTIIDGLKRKMTQTLDPFDISRFDNRIGGPKQLVLYSDTLAAARRNGEHRRSLWFESEDQGKYEFKFSIKAQ